MTRYIATIPGLCPLPDWSKEALEDLKGHQKHDLISGDEDVEIISVYDRVREELIAEQIDVGLDLQVEGQARWDDMLAHPLCIHDNVETGGIVRYYNNNNFYRDPIVRGKLTDSGDIATELETAASHTESLQAVVPGPYSLADLATDEFYGDTREFFDAVTTFLAGEIGTFPDHETLFLLEPSLVVNPPDDEIDDQLSEAIDTVAASTKADVVVHTYWGAPSERVHAQLLDTAIDTIGYDFVNAVDDNIVNINEYLTKDSVAFGLVDGQNTHVEPPESIQDRVEWILNRIPDHDLETIYLTTNTELFYLPQNKYNAKLDSLVGARNLLGTNVEPGVRA